MKPEAQRITIAKACGWYHAKLGPEWFSPSGAQFLELPDYLNDLNAMHEAEKVLKGEQISEYAERWIEWNSTAQERAEAFLRTLGLWT